MQLIVKKTLIRKDKYCENIYKGWTTLRSATNFNQTFREGNDVKTKNVKKKHIKSPITSFILKRKSEFA